MKRTPLTYAGIIAALLAALTISITISNANANPVTTPVVKDKWSEVVDQSFSANVALGGDTLYKVSAQPALSATNQHKALKNEIQRLREQANDRRWKKKSQIVELTTKGGRVAVVFQNFRKLIADRYQVGVKNIDAASTARTTALEGAIQTDLNTVEAAANNTYNTAVETARNTREAGLSAAKTALDNNLSGARQAHKKGVESAKKAQAKSMKRAKKNFRKLVRRGKAQRAERRFSRAEERITGKYDKKVAALNETLSTLEKQAQADYDTAVATVQSTYVAAETAASGARAKTIEDANEAALAKTNQAQELVTANVEEASKTLQKKITVVNVGSAEAGKDSEVATYNKLVKEQINVLRRLNRNFNFPGNFGAEFEITTKDANDTTTTYVPRVVKVSKVVPLKCDGKDCKIVVRCAGKADDRLEKVRENASKIVHTEANKVEEARAALKKANSKAEKKKAEERLEKALKGHQAAKENRVKSINDFVSESTKCFKKEVGGDK